MSKYKKSPYYKHYKPQPRLERPKHRSDSSAITKTLSAGMGASKGPTFYNSRSPYYRRLFMHVFSLLEEARQLKIDTSHIDHIASCVLQFKNVEKDKLVFLRTQLETTLGENYFDAECGSDDSFWSTDEEQASQESDSVVHSHSPTSEYASSVPGQDGQDEITALDLCGKSSAKDSDVLDASPSPQKGETTTTMSTSSCAFTSCLQTPPTPSETCKAFDTGLKFPDKPREAFLDVCGRSSPKCSEVLDPNISPKEGKKDNSNNQNNMCRYLFLHNILCSDASSTNRNGDTQSHCYLPIVFFEFETS